MLLPRPGEAPEEDCIPYPVVNPSFEEEGGWTAYMDGFTYTTQTASHGVRSVSVTNGGANQMFTVPARLVIYGIFTLKLFYTVTKGGIF